jgi:hypothetical protein
MERHYTAAEIDAIRKGTVSLGIDETRAFELLGPGVDIYLNATTCRRCVPKGVWEYFIGGYQVIKKWLSYREDRILGRPLTKDEAREVTAMVRRGVKSFIERSLGVGVEIVLHQNDFLGVQEVERPSCL